MCMGKNIVPLNPAMKDKIGHKDNIRLQIYIRLNVPNTILHTMCVTCPNLQNNLMSLRNIMLYFMIKFVINDPMGSRVLNVLQNILLINK